MRKYVVYEHVNKINGKRYIGITCKKPEERWGKNGCGYRCSSYFFHAINKYGWDNFDHLILYVDLDENKAKQKEIELIKKHNTTNSKYGYNLTYGGQGNIPNSATRSKMSNSQKRVWLTDEYRQRMSKIRKTICSTDEFKRKASANSKKTWSDPKIREQRIERLRFNGAKEEFKEKMKAVTIGELNGFYGKKHSTETKLKMRSKKIGRKQTEEHKKKVSESMKKPVIMFDRNGEFVKSFPSATDAKIYVGSKYSSHINACCNGKRNTAYGYKWMYLEEYEKTKSAN